MKKILSFTLEVIKVLIISLVIVIPIRYFLFQPFFVRGESMEPNFENGDYLIVDEISYYFREPKRGEVIVFQYPDNPSQRFIKRIIGLPGETVEIKDGQIKISIGETEEFLNESSYLSDSIKTLGDVRVVLKNDEYFVLGDNRLYSFDSRRFGILPKDNIIGRVFLRAWPFASLNIFETPLYNK
ncbi:MAG: signal peptidase I [Candidatus Pacebacteria bacterium]|nr:signal peptidase I [Candidatus Paceibacterota bacterium]